MNTFQLESRPDVLEFTNNERIAENELFSNVLEKLKKNPNIKIGSKQIGPSEDYYECSISGQPFNLIYDEDYGPSIHSGQTEVIEALKQYFQ